MIVENEKQNTAKNGTNEMEPKQDSVKSTWPAGLGQKYKGNPTVKPNNKSIEEIFKLAAVKLKMNEANCLHFTKGLLEVNIKTEDDLNRSTDFRLR